MGYGKIAIDQSEAFPRLPTGHATEIRPIVTAVGGGSSSLEDGGVIWTRWRVVFF